MGKRAYAIINSEECHIGDFAVVGVDRFECIYRVASVKFDADGASLVCVTDAKFTNTVTVTSESVVRILLESEVELDRDGRFRRAD